MVVLQILTINDVYEIDNLPHLSAARIEGENDPSVTAQVCILPGDFVAPSLLSSLDSGRSMVDCLNEAGLDYASIGNHESDVDLERDLWARMRESKFKWINSNMPTFPLPPDISLPDHIVIECGNKKIALLGLAGEDRSVMKAGAFRDCEIIPIRESLLEWYDKLKSQVDLVVPMTHQYMFADRELAKEVGVSRCPVIIGGHDHSPFLEDIDGVKVVKVGLDAQNIGVIRVIWDDTDSGKVPEVQVQIKPCTDFGRDATVEEAVARHKVILKELENSVLFRIPPMFSSKGIRLRPTTTGGFLCDTLRLELGAEICCVGSGSIRAQRDYAGEEHFTYAMLKSEFAFETKIAVVQLPGKVISEMISYTRAYALQTPPVQKGAFLQTCSNVKWNPTTNVVEELCGKPVEADRLYTVGLNFQMLDGMDNVEPLMNYKEAQPKASSVWCDGEECTYDAKHAIVSYFSSRALFDMIHRFHGNLSEIDANSDGIITREEFADYFERTGKSSSSTKIMIDNLFAVCDLDRDNVVTKDEILSLAVNNLRFYHAGQAPFRLTVEEALTMVADVVGDLDDQLKSKIRSIDADGDGFITRAEVTAASLSGAVQRNLESVFI